MNTKAPKDNQRMGNYPFHDLQPVEALTYLTGKESEKHSSYKNLI